MNLKKALTWLALVPIVIVLGAYLFSPKPTTKATAGTQPVAAAPTASTSTTPNVRLAATRRPVMYELYTGW